MALRLIRKSAKRKTPYIMKVQPTRYFMSISKYTVPLKYIMLCGFRVISIKYIAPPNIILTPRKRKYNFKKHFNDEGKKLSKTITVDVAALNKRERNSPISPASTMRAEIPPITELRHTPHLCVAILPQTRVHTRKIYVNRIFRHTSTSA
jgi:hypothetical protein